MKELTEQDLLGIIWRDISIQKMANGEYVLILVCEEPDQAKRLLTVLHDNPFALKLFIKTDKIYVMHLEFSNSEYAIGYNTERTAKDYPPLEWLHQQKVNFLTTGILKGTTPTGDRIFWYDTDIKPLSKVSLN